MPSKEELVQMLGAPSRREPFVSRNMRGETIDVKADHYLWFRCGCHAYRLDSGDYTLRPCFRRDCLRRGKTPA